MGACAGAGTATRIQEAQEAIKSGDRRLAEVSAECERASEQQFRINPHPKDPPKVREKDDNSLSTVLPQI